MFGAEDLKVFQAVCILWSFEPCIGFDVVNLYFPWVACFLAPCTDGAVPEEDLFPQVSLSWPAFASVDIVIAEKAFSLADIEQVLREKKSFTLRCMLDCIKELQGRVAIWNRCASSVSII